MNRRKLRNYTAAMDNELKGMNVAAGELPEDAKGVMLVLDAEGRTLLVPDTRTGRTLKGDRLGYYGDVMEAARELEEARKELFTAVEHARERAGISWALIGFAVGLTESGARSYFGKPGL